MAGDFAEEIHFRRLLRETKVVPGPSYKICRFDASVFRSSRPGAADFALAFPVETAYFIASSSSEWAVNIQRDSYTSYIGRYPMAYFSIAENELIGREQYNLMQKMLLHCGLTPEKDED
ncbi:uncharacterized protein LOC116264542 [Nymphaea colorata]|nr:uncharacterized protein LOC116264542 [Nymphaea colorata]